VKFLATISLMCAIAAWFFAMLSVDCWRDEKKVMAVIFAAVSLLLGVGGVLIWILL
jgi:hypothetical protein